jgi:NAD(P)-dependent dehydrogenase (short-subunit alcohol dehydrogenase family)
MGEAIAQALLQPGHTLWCLSRGRSQALEAAAATAGAELQQWPVDLSDPLPAARRLEEALCEVAADRFGSACLINNAALVSSPGPFEATPAQELSDALRVGLEAVLLLSAAFVRATEAWPAERRLLNISSGLGRRAMAGAAAYCAVKAGMDHFSRAMALEQAGRPNPVKVASLAPGVIDTGMQQQLRAANPQRFPERERFAQLHAQGLLDSPAQAAAKVLAFLRRADFGAHPVEDVRESHACQPGLTRCSNAG